MARRKLHTANLDYVAQNLIRVLIASYFLAVSLRLIPGTNTNALAEALGRGDFAMIIGNGVVFLLAFLVLTGMWLRAAALALSVILFSASFFTNFLGPETRSLGDFWRDLALIGALFLTYIEAGPRVSARRAMFRYHAKVRKIIPKQPVQPRRVSQPARPLRARITPIAPHLEARRAEPEVVNIFADDFGDEAASA